MTITTLLTISLPNNLTVYSWRIKAHASQVSKAVQNHGFGNFKGSMPK